jgi:hypothetical protein
MYKIRHTQEDPNRFTGTSLGIGGKLWRVDMWMASSGDKMIVEGHTMKEGHIVQNSVYVKQEDIDWTPALRPRYYNIMTKPWVSLWMEQTGARQYKVGWNDRSVRMYPHIGDRAGKGFPVPFDQMAAIYEGNTSYHPLERALSMIKRRKDANSLCALTPNLAIERGPFGHTYLVYQAQRFVGVVHEGALRVDNTFNHPDLEGLEFQHEDVKKLVALLGPAT